MNPTDWSLVRETAVRQTNRLAGYQTFLERFSMKNAQSGFTLIELLIVIVIIGILSAVVVFSVRGINNNSATNACKSDVNTVSSAVEAYYAQNKAYPAVTTSTALATSLIAASLIKTTPTYGDSTKAGTAAYNSATGVLSATC